MEHRHVASSYQPAWVRHLPRPAVFSTPTPQPRTRFVTLRIATLLLSLLAAALPAQERDIVITGGWLFTSTGNDRIRNPGIVIRAGKFLRVGGDVSITVPNAER